MLTLPASASSLESCLHIAEMCGEWQLFCLALLCLMEKFLMPDVITERHVCEEPGPLRFIFPSGLDLALYTRLLVLQQTWDGITPL